MAWESTVAYFGIAGIFLFAVISIVLHSLPTDYNFLRNPLSDFATGRFKLLVTIAFLVLGIGVLALDIGLAKGLGGGKRVAIGVFFIGVFGLSRLLVAFFPSDVEGSERTTAGRIHTLLTAFGFLAIPLAAIVLTPVFGRVYERVTWASVYSTLRMLELAVVVLGVVLLLTRMRSLRFIFGLVERLFYLTSSSWLFVLGLHFALMKH